MTKVFIIEDNVLVRETVRRYLELEDFDVKEFPGIGGVLQEMDAGHPDLIILDIMLPDGNGFKFAKQIREFSQVPIVFLTVRGEESNRITGFEIGGDDYVVKPFSPRELVLRIHAVLARSGKESGHHSAAGVWQLDGNALEIDEEFHRVEVNDEEVNLTGTEWKILVYLALNGGRVIPRETLLEACLGYSYEGYERTIDTHIKNLRSKLGSPDWIETVRGYGYRFSGTRARPIAPHDEHITYSDRPPA